MTIECYHTNCLHHAKTRYGSTYPLCGRADSTCQFPNDIVVWPDGTWCRPEDLTHAERVLGAFMRIITNGVSEEELDLVARNAAYGNVRSFAYPLKWFRTTRPDYLP